MKIEEKIYDLNLQTDDEACQAESKRIYKKYHTLGVILFYGGMLLTVLSFAGMIGLIIYMAINKTSISIWFMICFIGAILFGILTVTGKIFRAIAKTIVIRK